MTYQRFEDLPVWQDAIQLAEWAEDFLEAARAVLSRGKADQLDRCSLSVSNNVAEGFERGTTRELLAFLYIARGSAGEVRSMMRFFERRPQLAAHRQIIAEIARKAESCGRQLRAWADSLQNSDIEGQRHLDDNSRDHYRKRKEQAKAQQAGDDLIRSKAAQMPDGHPFKEMLRRQGKL